MLKRCYFRYIGLKENIKCNFSCFFLLYNVATRKFKNYICDLHCIYVGQPYYIKRQNLSDMSESVINNAKESNLNIYIY